MYAADCVGQLIAQEPLLESVRIPIDGFPGCVQVSPSAWYAEARAR
jgi:hypothetical protein